MLNSGGETPKPIRGVSQGLPLGGGVSHIGGARRAKIATSRWILIRRELGAIAIGTCLASRRIAILD